MVLSLLDDHYLLNPPKEDNEYVYLNNNIQKWLRVYCHSYVTDLNGLRLCRPIEYDLGKFFTTPERAGYFSLVCRMINLFLKNKIYYSSFPENLYPNVMIALGKANELSSGLQSIFRGMNGQELNQGSITLAKIICPASQKLTGFEFRDAHPLSSFNPKKMKVILVEDFVGTGLSIRLAKDYLEGLGAKVIAVVSIFNCLGKVWPFGVPINLTVKNLSFTKHPAGTCLSCQYARDNP